MVNGDPVTLQIIEVLVRLIQQHPTNRHQRRIGRIGRAMLVNRYDPWGKERYSVNTTPTGYRYTGQRHDDTLGLYDYKARYYDPDIGRFISADTIIPDEFTTKGRDGGEGRLAPLTVDSHQLPFLENVNSEHRQFVNYGSSILWDQEQSQEFGVPNGLLNPQSLNRYSYVMNRPQTHVDPSGNLGIEVEFTLEQAQKFVEDLMYWGELIGDIGVFSQIIGAITAAAGAAYAYLSTASILGIPSAGIGILGAVIGALIVGGGLGLAAMGTTLVDLALTLQSWIDSAIASGNLGQKFYLSIELILAGTKITLTASGHSPWSTYARGWDKSGEFLIAYFLTMRTGNPVRCIPIGGGTPFLIRGSTGSYSYNFG